VGQASHKPAFVDKEQNKEDHDANNKHFAVHLLLCDGFPYVSNCHPSCSDVFSVATVAMFKFELGLFLLFFGEIVNA
jgi:hypothetical protein